MKVIRKILTVSTAIIMFLLYPSAVHAEIIELPYLVNGQIHPTQSMMRNLARMFFVQIISFEYQSGKVLLSFNAKGTGNIYVGDTLYLNSISTGQSYTYKASDERCVTNEFNSVTPPIDITNILTKGMNTIQIRFDDRCGMLRPMGQIYIVNTEKTELEPFLNLPWDFERKGLSFTTAALSMTSFFDHEYPLLSSNLKEPIGTDTTIIKFDNSDRTHDSYSSHDGYDYARKGQALLGEPVLAAASGWASYINSCKACGNMIVIDHPQGYETQYLHLQKDNLIISSPGNKVWVNERQPIGKIGATGNVYPSGDLGAHIHFGVVEDKNHNGTFSDNIPDGMTDPFGWQVKDGTTDPWEQYSFIQNGSTKKGNKSRYLWKTPLATMKSMITSDGGEISMENFSVNFNENTIEEPLMVEIRPSIIPLLAVPGEILGYALDITARNFIDTLVTEFKDLFEINMKVQPDYLSQYNINTLALYTSKDGTNWTKDPTKVNLANNTLRAKVNHLSYFVFTAEKKDIVPPKTQFNLQGEILNNEQYKSKVILTLQPDDNESAVDYTLYTTDGQDWKIYTTPLTFSENGNHKIQFYSVDTSDNFESIQQVEFKIQADSPEAEIYYDPTSLELKIKNKDLSEETIVNTVKLSKNGKVQQINLQHEDITLLSFKLKEDKQATLNQLYIDSIQYSTTPPQKVTSHYFATKIINTSNDNYKKLLQIFEIKNSLKVKLEYSYKKDKTMAQIEENGQRTYKEEFNGLKLLKLNSTKGKLMYVF